MTRTAICTVVCLLFISDQALSLDKSPSPVDPEILKDPKPEHLPTLIGALNGCGCSPKRSDVGDALAQIGKPSVAPLIKRLNSTTKWWIQLECVHILALIGPEAEDAADEVEAWMTSGRRHGLPKSYAVLAVAAMRSDTKVLVESLAGSGSRPRFVTELFARFDDLAKQAEPELKKLAAGDSRVARYASEALEAIEKARAAKKSKSQKVAASSQAR